MFNGGRVNPAATNPVDVEASRIIGSVAGLPVTPAATSSSADSVKVQGADAFAKFKTGAGSGASKLFANEAPQFADRATGLFAALQGKPIDVQAAVLAKLVHDVTPVRE